MAKKSEDVFDLIGDALEWEKAQVKAVRGLAKKTGTVVAQTTETVVRVGTHVAGALAVAAGTLIRELGRK